MDAGVLFDLDSDPEVMRYLTGGKPTSFDVIQRDVLPRFMEYYERSSDYGFWAALHRQAGNFLGWFHLRPPYDGPPHTAEVGYRLRRDAWGFGYATEGTLALIDQAFSNLGVERVVAFTMAVNFASRRVMEKSGLEWVRTFYPEWADPISGAEAGEVEYALSRETYYRNHPVSDH